MGALGILAGKQTSEASNRRRNRWAVLKGFAKVSLALFGRCGGKVGGPR
jgi:hypothetical protein